jgi:drug/metabolite transporter (DMT)-like permease
LALCVAGVGLQIMAFALAPIPVVQSIFNAGLVLLILLSRVRLGERLHRVEWIGLAVVVVSLIAMSASLTGNSNSVGVGGSAGKVLLAAVPTLALGVLLVWAIRSRWGRSGFLYGVVAGLLYGVAALGTKGASTLVVGHGVLSSIPQILTSVYPYVFLVFSVLGMLIYQTGLQRFRISVVGSMSDVVCSTYIVAVGMVVFGETLPKDPVTLVLRLAGFAGVLVGSVLVATGRDEPGDIGPVTESDLGLGPALVAEVDAIGGRSIEDAIAGTHVEPISDTR